MGMYSHPGYGKFRLCSSEGHPTDEYCQDVNKSFEIINSSRTRDTFDDQVKTPQLLALWPRTDSTHLRLTHYRSNVFRAYTPTIFPNGFGTDKSPFQVNGTLNGEICAGFVVEGDSVTALAMLYCQSAMSPDSWNRDWNKTALAWFNKLD